MDAVHDISKVPASFPVGFCLLTHKDRQYVAYYDAGRNMAVASRTLDSDKWEYCTLPTRIGWDSHNYVTMAADRDDCVHLSGNMHCVPLKYFRMHRAGDITSFKRQGMTGRREGSCTYPHFIRGPAGDLLFKYRDGGSGDGVDLFNVYDEKTKAWRPLVDKPLIDGRRSGMSGYHAGPKRLADGWFHMAIVWRDTGDCSTCHDISYVRSRDLLKWENGAGEPVELPIHYRSKGIIIDPVPARGGLINMGFGVGLDHEKRPVVTYTKYDRDGKSQIYNARLEDGKWALHQASDWSWRWAFRGGGAIPSALGAGAVRALPRGDLIQSYWHPQEGHGTWKLDPQTLKAVGTHTGGGPRLPPGLQKPESEFPGLKVRWAGDHGRSGERKVHYRLRWETLEPNRDRPRKGKLPEPSVLRLYRLVAP